MDKWPRKKAISKRRWIARFHQGKPVPYLALEMIPELKQRLRPHLVLGNMDAVIKPNGKWKPVDPLQFIWNIA